MGNGIMMWSNEDVEAMMVETPRSGGMVVMQTVLNIMRFGPTIRQPKRKLNSPVRVLTKICMVGVIFVVVVGYFTKCKEGGR